MYRVYFTNFQYFADPPFGTLKDALEYAKKSCFDSAIVEGESHVVATWSYFGGVRYLYH